jgi:putative membrane protein
VLSPPPPRARWKALLSYHFLAAGHDGTLAVAVTGRLRRETTWVPLAKTQSVRLVQGPLQRWLGLATVHLDAAGRRVRAEFRERRQEEARSLVDDLAVLSRTARRQASQAASVASPVNASHNEV